MQALLSEGQGALAQGSYEEAIEAFTKVLQSAPGEYTLCMKSLLGRRDAYAALGARELSRADNTQEFAWGRGVRWPGWYIIGAILFRNEIVRD
jgi:tetratricopeptide (TPR) repeat protein